MAKSIPPPTIPAPQTVAFDPSHNNTFTASDNVVLFTMAESDVYKFTHGWNSFFVGGNDLLNGSCSSGRPPTKTISIKKDMAYGVTTASMAPLYHIVIAADDGIVDKMSKLVSGASHFSSGNAHVAHFEATRLLGF